MLRAITAQFSRSAVKERKNERLRRLPPPPPPHSEQSRSPSFARLSKSAIIIRKYLQPEEFIPITFDCYDDETTQNNFFGIILRGDAFLLTLYSSLKYPCGKCKLVLRRRLKPSLQLCEGSSSASASNEFKAAEDEKARELMMVQEGASESDARDLQNGGRRNNLPRGFESEWQANFSAETTFDSDSEYFARTPSFRKRE